LIGGDQKSWSKAVFPLGLFFCFRFYRRLAAGNRANAARVVILLSFLLLGAGAIAYFFFTGTIAGIVM